MKKTLILSLLTILFLSSCNIMYHANRQRKNYYIWFPGKAALKGKNTPCKLFPKPIYKN